MFKKKYFYFRTNIKESENYESSNVDKTKKNSRLSLRLQDSTSLNSLTNNPQSSPATVIQPLSCLNGVPAYSAACIQPLHSNPQSHSASGIQPLSCSNGIQAHCAHNNQPNKQVFL